jgi:hypothetical protein
MTSSSDKKRPARRLRQDERLLWKQVVRSIAPLKPLAAADDEIASGRVKNHCRRRRAALLRHRPRRLRAKRFFLSRLWGGACVSA